MTDLVALLRSFNRKERFILLTQVSGGVEPLTVSDHFRNRINEELPDSLQIPALDDGNYVLAMDFHLNWLAAALQLTFRGKSVDQDLIQDSFDPSLRDADELVLQRWIFERNQEDIDLLLGWRGADARSKLVLVEAKAHGPFSTKQLGSKSARFAAIFGPDGQTYAKAPVDIAVVLAGFKAPQQPQFIKAWDELARRETGAHGKKRRFVTLSTEPEVLLVGEFDATGKPKKDGGHWRVRKKSFSVST